MKTFISQRGQQLIHQESSKVIFLFTGLNCVRYMLEVQILEKLFSAPVTYLKAVILTKASQNAGKSTSARGL